MVYKRTNKLEFLEHAVEANSGHAVELVSWAVGHTSVRRARPPDGLWSERLSSCVEQKRPFCEFAESWGINVVA
jgi:hypothetical protein